MNVCKKIAYIFLCGLVCAGLLMWEKSYFADFTVQTGAFSAECLLSIEKSPTHAERKEITYDELLYYILRSDFNIKKTIESLENDTSFHFDRLVKNWSTFSSSDKIRWFKKHTHLYGADRKNYTLQLYIDKGEVIDAAFLEQKGSLLLKALVENTIDTLHVTHPYDSVTVLNNKILYPPPATLTRLGVIKKYGIIGFGQGIILAAMVMLWYRIIQGKRDGFIPNEHLLLLKQVFIKKSMPIFLCGILCAGLLVSVQSVITEFSVRKGSGEADYIIVMDETINQSLKVPRDIYKDLRGTYYNNNHLEAFIKTLRETNSFSVEKMILNWEKLNQEEQKKWLRNHIGISARGGSITCLYFYIKDSEIKDSQYFEQNIYRFMDLFINFTVDKFAYPRPDMVQVASKSLVMPENIKVEPNPALLQDG